MVGPDPMLQAYVRLLRRSTGARVVSLYVPTPDGSYPGPLLLHDGEPPVLPELTDPRTADEFCRDAALRPVTWQPIASGSDDGWLVRLPSLEELFGISTPEQPDSGRDRRRSSDRGKRVAVTPDCSPWLGLRLEPGAKLDSGFRNALSIVAAIGPDEQRTEETWTGLLPVAGALAWHNQQVALLIREPVSGLPGRTVLQMVLKEALEQARERRGDVALLLINPDEFQFVNERFGRDAGDTVVREIAGRLTATLRRTDFVCRYGGAIFGVALPDAQATDVGTLSSKLRSALQVGGYLDGSLRLSFSFGAASYAPGPAEASEEALVGLLRRTDRALNAAKLAGGGRTTVCTDGRELEEAGQFDRLCGIFTANQAKDYRNMLLLWDTVRAVASTDDVARLVDTVLQRLVATFHSDRALLFERADEGHRLFHAVSPGSEESAAGPDEEMEPLLVEAGEQGRAVEHTRTTGNPPRERMVCAVPLTTGEQHVGALVLDGDRDALALDASDRILLKALGGQLAIALDRARLVQQERRRLERESDELRQELNELRQVLGDAKLLHESKAMEAVLAVARRVAPTEATVLIHGESGTGKELVARTVHGLSRRRERPLVIVDCSAIATSLIDSELFGHERGAYTGAERRAPGRLAEADGGTILLDEIGELPLEVQGKLLRFVQEKQFTMVGGTKPKRVDVRVLAATNRDLAAEAAAGRFREDLYFRLRVVQLTLPPLRERPEDVLLLSRHFVERFARENGRETLILNDAAAMALVAHDWPGNVRELQNRTLQAVILADDETIGPRELGLEPVTAGNAVSPPDGTVVPGPRATAIDLPERPDPNDAQAALRLAVTRRVDAALEATPQRVVPLGRWLAADAIVEAYRSAGETYSQAAALVGIAETTFRRRYQKARQQIEAGVSARPEDWAEMRSYLATWIAAGNPVGDDLLSRLRELLIGVLSARVPDDTKLGARLMGVTEPTYRKWLAAATPPPGS